MGVKLFQMSITCPNCEQPVHRHCYTLLQKYWHGECTRCCECSAVLREKCFYRNNGIFCFDDYSKVYGKCPICNITIEENTYVLMVKSYMYHIDCFRCVQCMAKLTPGDKFYYINRRSMLCCDDYFNHYVESQPTQNDEEVTSNSESDSEVESKSVKVTGRKKRGPRTSIKPDQLKILMDAYKESTKPSRHIREKLSKETNLDIRVIQIWYQNRRSKDKKNEQTNNYRQPGTNYYNPNYGGYPMYFDYGQMNYPTNYPFEDTDQFEEPRNQPSESANYTKY